MQAITTIQITGPAGEKTTLKMKLERFTDMTQEQIQLGIEDYQDLLIADIEAAIADLETQWEDG